MKSREHVHDIAVGKHQCEFASFLSGLAERFPFFFWTVMSRVDGPPNTRRVSLLSHHYRSDTRHRIRRRPSRGVKQARFEPAHNAGKNVPGEFTYVDDSGSR